MEVTERRIKVAKPPAPKVPGDSAQRLLWTFCYYFPAYTYQEAMELPFPYVREALKTVRREKAKEFINLTNIASAPHTKKGEGVKKLLSHFGKEANV